MTDKKYKITVIVLDALAVIGILTLKSIAKFMIDYFPECYFLSNFGIECPSCGGTRCVFQFFGGNFGEAFLLNPLFFLAIVYIIVLFVFMNLSLFGLKFARRAVRIMTAWQVPVIFAVGLALLGIIRLIF